MGNEPQINSGRIVTHSADETRAFGRSLGSALAPGAAVFLVGALGAGKSVLARGIGEALGIERWKGSPTFTLVHEYQAHVPLYHIDLYRLSEAQVRGLAMEEYLRADSIALIEWADRAERYLQAVAPGEIIRVELWLQGLEDREIEWTAPAGASSGVTP